VVVAGVLGVIGILGRRSAETVLANRTQELAAPPVQAARATPGAPVNTLILPGNVTAFTDSPIYARTSGYLTHWYYDIGARVKKGALAGRDFHSGARPATRAGRKRPGDGPGGGQQRTHSV